MNYLEEDGIEHRQTTLLWPQANGEIKKQNCILKHLCIAPVYRSSTGSPLEIRDGQLIVPNILLLGLARQKCCLEDASGPNYPSPRVQHSRWGARSWQWEKRKREGICRLAEECMWRRNSRRWDGQTKIFWCYWDRRKKTNCQVAIQTARQMEFSLPFSTVLVYLNYMFLRIECNNDCCNTCMCIHMITVTSDGP